MKNSTNKKQTKTERQANLKGRKSKEAKALSAKPTKRGKKADVITIAPPSAPKSVVGKAWKDKAGKTGVWKDDKVNDAVRSAFLREGGAGIEPLVAARKATDTILAENGLDAGRWGGLNAGMLSMNLRNVLRGLLRNDGVVFVLGKKISA